ncbi:glycosyltransferase [Melioribacteraceae bacterium 4301-Me]|uniref:glycosyltransferase n=1 Tax=Pyranulibacter aquaticus TaxID=3163344 RepID=UPI00359A465A
MELNHERKENWHEDFIVYLASQFRPKIYVELGLYHCELFNKMIPFAEILIGVDISPEARKWMTISEKTTFINSSTDQFAEALKRNPIFIDLLFIDADHSKESVLKDFWNFFPFVNDQGLILLHDTYPKNIHYTDKRYCGDAYLAVEELKKYQNEFGFELTTIPIHPGLSIIRKRKKQISWIEEQDKPNEVNEQLILKNKRYKIIAITQVFNELRKSNLERFWKYLQPVVDGLVVYDDGSSDGSFEYLSDKAMFILRGGENDFKNEINHKKVLLEKALELKPDFVLWLDADEVLTANAAIEIQNLCRYADENEIDGISFHEINLWRSNSWQRVDNAYDDGWFVRLWRVTQDLQFHSQEAGLHQQQYPHSIKKIEKTDKIAVIHYGFASDRSLAFKYLVYRAHGQSGWALERLLDEKTLQLRKVNKKLFPDCLYVEDLPPKKRSFEEALTIIENYRDEVFKPRISIICLIYKSIEWLEFVYQQVIKYTDLHDKEFFFVANDATDEVLKYLEENYIPYYVWNNSDEQKTEWYINNVYRAWNFGAKKAKGDYLLFINSDMAFTSNWIENLYNKLDGHNCVTSRLVESGKFPSGKYGISKNFGRSLQDYNEQGFIEFAKSISEENLKDGGLFMPLLIKREHFDAVGGYPEGNIVPGSNPFQPIIAKKGEACISGDVVLMQKLSSIGIFHKTAFDSLVYHFQCGEMDSIDDVKIKRQSNRVIIANDYLKGRMGEKTMWEFLLEKLPNSAGVDMDILGTTENFTENASNYISKNFPESSIIIQNASFIDRLSKDRFTICYLQDNLRAMGRLSYQQETNLKHADLLVTNSRLTAKSYPEYNFEIIPIGVDDSLFKPMNKNEMRKEFNFPNKRIGIFVGDFGEVKGWSKVKSLIDNHPEIFWILVSKDNLCYTRDNCKTFNRIQQDLLVKLLNCADFFILGSPVETQCLAAIEACLCNLPIIMRNTGIFADFTEEEKSKVGIFGEDFEYALKEIEKRNFTPRKLIIEKGFTVNGMVDKWKKVIQKARLLRENLIKKSYDEKPPLFTVIIPTYNHAQYLGAALDSLLAQTFRNWEAIIVNDGSTDNTKEVIEKYLLLDKRFRAIHKQNGGVASALNVGINNAKGEWICWLSSDDLFEPNKLEIHFNAIKENPDIKFFHSHWYLLIEETKQKIAPGLWLQIPPTEFQVLHFFWANYVHGNSIAVHKSVFDDVGLFDETLRQGQDFDMWLRISSKYKSHFINERTCVTRIHKGQTTNSFLEGGVFDSTYSLIRFLNEKPFNALFPFTDFSNPNKIFSALNEIVFVLTKKDAFLYRCGFTSALAEKTLEWINNCLQSNIRKKAYDFLEVIVKDYLAKPLSEEVKNILKLFLNRKKVLYSKHDFIEDACEYVKLLVEKGNQKYTAAIETYLMKILKHHNELNKQSKIYKPIIVGYESHEKYSVLNTKDIIKWYVEPLEIKLNSIRHRLEIHCPECNNNFNVIIEYEMVSEHTTSKFICPTCKLTFEFSDKNFAEDFVAFNKNKTHEENVTVGDIPHIAFFIKDASVVGGGTKILFKHIDWLIKLGADVTVYSYSAKPDWIKQKLNYVIINSIEEIDTSKINLFVVFSIFDLPAVLNKLSLSKVVHLCQGYEGYHYGRTYEELRSDKHILTMLHAIPVKNISVSSHLVNLFKEKFNRVSEYVPNSVDHKIFKPGKLNDNNTKSILFIGNPWHPLKGFKFLASAIVAIQKSKYRIQNLKLNIVVGYETENINKIQEELSKELDCIVEIREKLNSEKVAEVIRNSSVVVCTSWYEGFSMPLLEAMASGVPVITTNNMGAESFCMHERNSFVVKYNDHENFIKYLLDILYSRINLNPILRNAYRTSLEYNEYNSLNAFINVYQNLLGYSFPKSNVEKLLNEIMLFNNLTEIEKNNYEGDLFGKNVSVIIPVYNNVDYTRMCIESLIRTTPQLAELIIIDNNSKDSTNDYLTKLENEDSRVKIIRNTLNVGFPNAVNQGLKESSAEFIVVANNDIIFTEGWTSRFIEIADSDKRIGLVGPVSNLVSGVQIDNEAKYNSITDMHIYAEKVKNKRKGEFFEFPRIAFLCTLIKREVIDKIGGLDERFSPGNFEDDDFCLRAQLAGFKTVIAKDVFIHHFGSKSFKANGLEEYSKRLEINKQIFIDKWGADPEEIWLKGKNFKKRNLLFPLDKDIFVENVKRAMILLEEKDFQFAQLFLENAIYNYNNSSKQGYEELQLVDLLNLTGNTALLNGDLEKAQLFFEKELQLNPSSSRACLGLAETYYAAEMYSEAKTMFEWALKNDPLNDKAFDGLINANAKLNFNSFHYTLESNHSAGKISESEILIENGELGKAKSILLELLSNNPFDVDVLNNLAVVFIIKKEHDLVIKLFERIQKIDPQNEIALENLNYFNSILDEQFRQA